MTSFVNDPTPAELTTTTPSISENCSASLNHRTADPSESSTLHKASTLLSQKRKTVLSSQSTTTTNSNSKLPRIDETNTTILTQSKHVTTRPQPTQLKVNELNDRMEQLFPDSRVLSLPCTSARLFACFNSTVPALPVSSAGGAEKVEDTPRRSRRIQKQQVLEPILAFLQSLVLVEVVSLEEEGEAASAARARPRRIAFSGFDCSSTRPPVDRIDGSAEHQSNSIQALSDAKQQLDAILSDKKNQAAVIVCLERLIEFLSTTLLHDNSLQRVCALSVSPLYPVGRLGKPIRLYSKELNLMLGRIKGETSELLFIERHLNELLCRTIRHHMRLLFNPPPPRLTPLDTSYEQRSQSFSKIHELVIMATFDEKNKLCGVDGDRIASLVNDALMQVCYFFGSQNLLDPTYTIATISSTFCASDAAQRQIPKNNKVVLPLLTAEEINDLRADIDETFQVLITHTAISFLYSLLSLPQVNSELKRLGGWGDIETYATLLWRHELWECQPENEHFVLLSNFKTFMTRLSSMKTAMEAAAVSAEVTVKDLFHRFRLNAKKANKAVLVRHYPEMEIVEEMLQDGWQQVHEFPEVCPVD